jgi:Flagellar motor protein
VRQLTQEVGSLQSLLDVAAEEDRQAQVQVQALGSELNAALAQAAQNERRAREAEAEARRLAEAEAARLAAEAENLEQYRSDFFGEMRQILEDEEDVQIVGDRFVFSSEVLFPPGSATLSDAGQEQIASIVSILQEIAAEVPDGIDWIIRVDGHTDNVPISSGGEYADNWELSQARALSVVRYMEDELGFPPERLAANGFGEHRPLIAQDTAEARAANRRIELKLTER